MITGLMFRSTMKNVYSCRQSFLNAQSNAAQYQCCGKVACHHQLQQITTQIAAPKLSSEIRHYDFTSRDTASKIAGGTMIVERGRMRIEKCRMMDVPRIIPQGLIFAQRKGMEDKEDSTSPLFN